MRQTSKDGREARTPKQEQSKMQNEQPPASAVPAGASAVPAGGTINHSGSQPTW